MPRIFLHLALPVVDIDADLRQHVVDFLLLLVFDVELELILQFGDHALKQVSTYDLLHII